MCVHTYAQHAQHASQRARARGRARRERASTSFVSLCIRMFVCFCVCMLASMYVYMCVCTSACIDSLLSAPVRECVRAHTGGSSARPLDVHPYVHECMCMHVYMDTCTSA